MNLQHVQLDPSVNRARKVRGVGPASPARVSKNPDQPKCDPLHPYVNTHLGLFRDVITDDQGRERPYAFYIPTTMRTSGNMVLVLIPGKEDPEAFFKKNGWKEALERHEMTAYFLGAPEGWDEENMGTEIDAAVKVFAEMQSMEYFACNAPGIYCLGFGGGAKVAAAFSVIYQSVLAAWGAWGDTELDPAFLNLFGNSATDCDASMLRKELQLPTFIVGPASDTLEYFKGACRVKEEYLFNGFARVFREQPKPGAGMINEYAQSEVWLAAEEEADKLGAEVLVEKLVAFVEDYKRWGGEGNSHVRHTERPEKDLHMIRNERIINGYLRYWYTFEPSAYKKGLKEKYPLIIAIHGFSCSGEFFAENSGWHKVGEERGAIVVYPTAYPFYMAPNPGAIFGTGIATPHWNSGSMFSSEPLPTAPDDVDFIRQMVDIVTEQYPVDEERIYVTGHSNGSAMTQRIMRCLPARFAGFAPVGFMECGRERTKAPTDGIARNVWYVIGEYDGAGCSLEGDNGNNRTIEMICEANGLDAWKRKYYETGIYMNTVIRTDDGVPMVRFTGIKNWPHTYTPELAFKIYDEFFSQFVRHADGSLEYLG